MRFDVLKCQSNILSTLNKAAHKYELLPSKYKNVSRQQFDEIIAFYLGAKTFAAIKANPDDSTRLMTLDGKESLTKFYKRNNPEITESDLKLCVNLFNEICLKVLFCRAQMGNFILPLQPKILDAISDIKLVSVDEKLIKKPNYQFSTKAIYQSALNGNWLKILILPIAHNFIKSCDSDYDVLIDINKCFDKKLDTNKQYAFHLIWNENFNRDDLPPDYWFFLNDYIESMKKDVKTFQEFQAIINPAFSSNFKELI